MEMDIQTGIICLGVAGISAVAIVVIFIMFGMKEKTYDEAIAEQRKMPEENLLLTRAKEKLKEKKQKKAGKKVKEKTAESEKNSRSDGVGVATSQAVEKPIHVDFEEPEAEVVSERTLQEDHKKMKKKKDKVKPILLNKDTQSPVVDTPPVPANHFEEILPKDDFLLKRKESKEDTNVKTSDESRKVKEATAPVGDAKKSGGSKGSGGKVDKSVSNKPEKQAAQKVSEKNALPKVEKDTVVATPVAAQAEKEEPVIAEKNVTSAEKVPAPQRSEKSSAASKVEKPVEHGTPPAVSKERGKKKKNNDLATLQQMSGEREGVNVSLLVPLVRKAELSRSEIQILIDLLLNKQQEGPAALDSEWIEGRQDPMVKLKKQLAEKEKSLAEEQEASQAFQSKLKELRAELNSERSRLLQACRQLEESVSGKQNEVQALTSRLQHATESHNTDKQTLAQVQAKHGEEQGLLRKLQQDLEQSQGAFQQELVNQRQQLELHITGLGEQMAQMEGAYKAQVEQLHLQLQEQENMNSSLNAELSQKQRELEEFSEKLVHMQKAATQHLAVQLEESRKVLAEVEDRLAYSQQSELEQQQMCVALQEQLDTTAVRKNELEGEVMHLSVQVANIQRLQEENKQLAEQVSALPQLELEVQQLREENESLATQMTAVTERPAAEGRENGDLHYAEEKAAVPTQDDSAKQAEALLEEVTAELKQKTSALEHLSAEVVSYKTEVSRLSEELDSQREKNNALRTKNWKVMEALSAAEKTAESKVKQSEKLVSESVEKAKVEDQSCTKQLLLRIFPEISIQTQDHHQWLTQFEKYASGLLSELKSRPQHNSSAMLLDAERNTNELQTAVANYKSIIKTMEGELEKVKNQAEQEMNSYRKQLEDKTIEIAQLHLEKERLEHLANDNQQMQANLLELQKKLEAVSAEKIEVTQKYEALQMSSYELQTELMRCRDAITSLQQINEELGMQLSILQKQQQAKACSNESRLAGNGEDSASQQQMDKFNGVEDSHLSVAANGANSEPSTPEGGSGKK